MKKLLWATPLLIVGIAFASYQVYMYEQSSNVEENIIVDDTNKLVLPTEIKAGQIYCGSWTFVNHAVTGQQVIIGNEVSVGFSGNFTLNGNDMVNNQDAQVEATPNILNIIAGCFTVKGDSNGEQKISLTISRI
jgi:hypothetical protein